MKNRILRRSLSFLLALCLMAGLLPTVRGASSASLSAQIAELPLPIANNRSVGYPLYDSNQNNFRDLNGGSYLLVTDTKYGGSYYALNPLAVADNGTLRAFPVEVSGNTVLGADPSWAVTLDSFTPGANGSNSAAATFTVKFHDGKYLNFTATGRGIGRSATPQAITFYAHYGHGGMHLRLDGNFQMRLNYGVSALPYFDLQKDHFSQRTDLILYKLLPDRLNAEPLYNAIKASEPYVKYSLLADARYQSFLTTLESAIALYNAHNGGSYTAANRNALDAKTKELQDHLNAMPLTRKTAANAAKLSSYAAQLVSANPYYAQSFTWDSEGKTDRWRYFNGLMMDALQMTGNETYTALFYNYVIADNGTVAAWNDGHIDSIAPARGLLDLLDTSYEEKFRKTVAYAISELDQQIRYANCGNNFTHQQGLYNGVQTVSPNTSYCWHYWTLALDGLYMALPFLMECAREMDKGTLTIPGKTASGLRTEVYDRLIWVADNMYNSASGLYHHAWSSSASKGNEKYWTRGTGWYAMTLVDVISLMPQGAQRNDLISRLPRLFDGMLPYQDAATGMWYNMTQYNRSLTSENYFTRSYTMDNSTFSNVETHANDLETSGTAMMAYALLKAYNSGWVGKKYADAGIKAFNGTVDTYLWGREGSYRIGGSYKAGWARETNQEYLYSTYENDEAKGTAPLIMAAVMAKETALRLEGGKATLTGNSPITVHKGSKPDYSGIRLTLSYADGSTKTLSTANGLNIPTPDGNTLGSYSMNISYDGIVYGSVTVTVSDANHTFTYTNVDSNSHKLTCPCGYSKTEAHSFSFEVTKEPTLTATGSLKGSCSKCSGTKTVTLPKLNTTDYSKTVIKAATCTVGGTDSYTWNTTTYGSFSFSASSPASGHSYTSKVTPPTCTAQGYTTYTCTPCSHTYKDNYTNAKGHTEVIDKAVPATCTASGKTEGKHCSVCNTVLVKQETVAPLGHSYTSKVTPPTCTAQGYTTYTCSVCKHSYTDSYTPITDHSYDSGTLLLTPTCTEEGIKSFSCTLCQKTKIEALPPLGHDEAVSEAVVPTCTQTGSTEGKYCRRCGTVLVQPQSIPATGHSFSYISLDAESHIVTCENCSLFTSESHSFTDGLCPCGETPQPIEETTWKLNHSLNLASDISVNFLIPKTLLTGFDLSTVYVESTVDSYKGNDKLGTTTLQLLPVDKGQYYYFILDGLTAVRMNDSISSVLYGKKNGQLHASPTDVYSIATYAYSQLNKTTAQEKLKHLCADLLRYGSKAQIYKGYRTDALADTAMTASHRSYLSDLDTVTFGNTNVTLNDLPNAPITWAGKSLNLESKVTLKFIFSTANYQGSLDKLSLKLSYTDVYGTKQTRTLTEAEAYDTAKSLYAFSFDGLLAAELRSVVSVQIFNATTPLSPTLQYSADTYGNNKTGNLLLLCKALFAYSDTAKSYFTP